MTGKQNKTYFGIWKAICIRQGWLKETKERQKELRYDLHREIGLPESHSAWSNDQFSEFISKTAHLRERVDIRNRKRENVTWTIERLQAAFKLLLGEDYARAILISFGDTIDLDNFPIEDQSRIDLENIRNTLKNRLGRVIQRLKTGQLKRGPKCPEFYDRSQAEIITALLYGRDITPRPAMVVQRPTKARQADPEPVAVPAGAVEDEEDDNYPF